MSAELLRQAAVQARAEAETHRSVVPHLIELYGDDCGSERQATRDLAVAEWLDFMAWQRETFQSNMSGFLTDHEARALAVARTYLGEDGARCSASEPLRRGIETYPNICSSGVGGGEVCMRRKGHDGDHDPDSTEVRL